MASETPLHQTFSSEDLAKVLNATTALNPNSATASTIQQILSLALQGGYTVLLSVMPELLSTLSTYSPTLGVVAEELLPALQSILAKLLAPAPVVVPVVPAK